MKKLLYLTLLLAVVAGGCTKELDGNDANPALAYDPTHVVTVATTIGESDNRTATRGTPITNVSAMTTLGLFGTHTGTANWNAATDVPSLMFNQQLTRNGTTGAWSYTGTPILWGSTAVTEKYTFFAYAPYATADNGISVSSSATTVGVPTLTYTVPTDVTKQPDLMVALPQIDLRRGTIVPLDMRHALTAVGFEIGGSGEQVTDISIVGVHTTGTLSMDGGTIVWSNLSGAATATSYAASINKDPGQNYYTANSDISNGLIAGNGYLMMIPQTLSATAKVVVSFNDGTKREISLTGGVWGPSRQVTYRITAAATVEFVVKNTDELYNHPTTVTGLFAGDTYTLPVAPPVRKEYTLVEWSTVNAPTGGTAYQPGATITLARGVNKLYPRWRQNSSDIIYFTGDDQLKIGRWLEVPLQLSDLVYFKFGSVIGMRSTAAFALSQIVYNPSNQSVGTGGSITGWGATNRLPGIPGWNSSDQSTYTSQPDTSLNVSGSKYHTLSNITQGKGDPCKLIGLTIAEIKNGTKIDNGLWRMPTHEENLAFAGLRGMTATYQPSPAPAISAYPAYDTSRTPPGAWLPVGGGSHFNQNTGRFINTSNGSFLPAMGLRNDVGTILSANTALYYWSNTPVTGTAISAYRLSIFGVADIRINAIPANQATPIRCVRQAVVVD